MSDFPHMPAEWEPHAALYTAWPADPAVWLDDLAPAQAAVAAMCRALAAGGERVVVLVAPGAACPVAGVAHAAVPYWDIWLRDTGPIFVRAGERLAAARFRWNGWGGKYDFAADHAVGDAVAALAGAPVRRHGWVLEGGAIEVDGAGRCLTTRQCLLNSNRNPGMDARAVEAGLRDALGVERVHWLGDGLRNDHTDGHVDNLARFVAPGVVLCMEPAPDDPHRDALAACTRDLVSFGLELVRIPAPGAVLDAAGAPMPASYLNYVVGNGAVVVPVYGTRNDDRALAGIAAAFPGRRVTGVNARGLLAGGGAFHCITKEQPA